MKKLSLILLSIFMALMCAGCSVSPCESVARELSKLKTYEDMIKRIPQMADQVLGLGEEELDANIFADTGFGRHAIPAYYAVEGTDWECALLCEDTKVAAFELASIGGNVTPAEFEDILSYAAAQFGEDYAFEETFGTLAANRELYTWEHLELAFYSYTGDVGLVVIKYA